MSGPIGPYYGDPLRQATRRVGDRRTEITNTSAGTIADSRYPDNAFMRQNPDLRFNDPSRAVAAPPQIPSFSRFVPTTSLKRKGVDNIPDSESIRRRRGGGDDLGGTTPGDLAALRSGPLGTNMQPPQFADSTPTPARFQAGPDGAPLMAGFGPMYDPYFRNVGPTGPRADAQGISWNRMPEKPTIFDSQTIKPSENERIAGTASDGLFIDPAERARADVSRRNPFETFPWDESARRRVNKASKTGKPNSRVKYTFTLSASASKFATVQEAYFPVVGVKQLQVMPTPSQIAANFLKAPLSETHVHDIIVTNWIIATEQTKPRGVHEVMEAHTIADKYRLLGVVAAESGQSQTLHTSRPEVSITQIRNLVVTMGGDAFSVYNFWGMLPYAAMVGFILKGVPIQHIWALNSRDYGSYNLTPQNEAAITLLDAGAVASVLLQFVPWAAKATRDVAPTDKELFYVDDFGVERMGIFFPLGYMLQVHGQVSNAEIIDRAWCSKAAAMAAGTVALIVSRKDVAV